MLVGVSGVVSITSVPNYKRKLYLAAVGGILRVAIVVSRVYHRSIVVVLTDQVQDVRVIMGYVSVILLD